MILLHNLFGIALTSYAVLRTTRTLYNYYIVSGSNNIIDRFVSLLCNACDPCTRLANRAASHILITGCSWKNVRFELLALLILFVLLVHSSAVISPDSAAIMSFVSISELSALLAAFTRIISSGVLFVSLMLLVHSSLFELLALFTSIISSVVLSMSLLTVALCAIFMLFELFWLWLLLPLITRTDIISSDEDPLTTVSSAFVT
ncbi:hypothetical protein ACHAWC_010611, partial [Mediolabrus comicus]